MTAVQTYKCTGCRTSVPITIEHHCRTFDDRPMSFRPTSDTVTEKAVELAEKFGGFVVTTGEAGVEIFRECTSPTADLVPGDQLAAAPSLSLAIERALENVGEVQSA